MVRGPWPRVALPAAQFIVPGKVEASYLLRAIARNGTHPKLMPRADISLTDDQIGVLTEWIEDGAFWPAGTAGQLEPISTGGIVYANLHAIDGIGRFHDWPFDVGVTRTQRTESQVSRWWPLARLSRRAHRRTLAPSPSPAPRRTCWPSRSDRRTPAVPNPAPLEVTM